jgi:hypothetical protein
VLGDNRVEDCKESLGIDFVNHWVSVFFADLLRNFSKNYFSEQLLELNRSVLLAQFGSCVEAKSVSAQNESFQNVEDHLSIVVLFDCIFNQPLHFLLQFLLLLRFQQQVKDTLVVFCLQPLLDKLRGHKVLLTFLRHFCVSRRLV